MWKNSAKPATSSPIARDHDLGAGPRAEQLLVQLLLGGLHFVEQALELGELADQLQDDGHVGRRGWPDLDASYHVMRGRLG